MSSPQWKPTGEKLPTGTVDPTKESKYAVKPEIARERAETAALVSRERAAAERDTSAYLVRYVWSISSWSSSVFGSKVTARSLTSFSCFSFFFAVPRVLHGPAGRADGGRLRRRRGPARARPGRPPQGRPGQHAALPVARGKRHGLHQAHHDSAEDFFRLKAARCTAMAWVFIPAYCFAIS